MTDTPGQNGCVESGALYLSIFAELKKEIAQSIKDARDTERNTLLICGALLTYILGRCPHPGSILLECMPAVFAIFGAIRVIVLMMSINPRSQYLAEMENLSLHGKPLPGWEEFFRSHQPRGVGISIFIFWTSLIVATLLIPMLITNTLCART